MFSRYARFCNNPDAPETDEENELLFSVAVRNRKPVLAINDLSPASDAAIRFAGTLVHVVRAELHVFHALSLTGRPLRAVMTARGGSRYAVGTDQAAMLIVRETRRNTFDRVVILSSSATFESEVVEAAERWGFWFDLIAIDRAMFGRSDVARPLESLMQIVEKQTLTALAFVHGGTALSDLALSPRRPEPCTMPRTWPRNSRYMAEGGETPHKNHSNAYE